ncbi:MAG: PDZ domain-containing protein [Spirochaetes bacterium]|nr:PDZ domain-containing protein [Spirochaetota bacterium]
MKKTGAFIIAVIAACALCAGCTGDEFGGLGIEVPSGGGFVTEENPYRIVSVYEGGTGHRAGLLPGDIITAVDGRELRGMQHEHIVKNMLRGRAGTLVVLGIKREDREMIFRVARGKIVLRQE